MIEPRDYRIQIDYDEAGVLVVVRHQPSGLELRERPSVVESVGAVKSRLIAQIEARFYPSEDFELSHYQLGKDGVRGGGWEVHHLPTGIKRSANTYDEPGLGFQVFEARSRRRNLAPESAVKLLFALQPLSQERKVSTSSGSSEPSGSAKLAPGQRDRNLSNGLKPAFRASTSDRFAQLLITPTACLQHSIPTLNDSTHFAETAS